MTATAIEILKQTESLSAQEQLELANKLMEQAQRYAKATPHNGRQKEALQVGPSAQIGTATGNEDEIEEELDGFSLKHVPPKSSYAIKARFVDGGHGQPQRYDFGDLFDDEEEYAG